MELEGKSPIGVFSVIARREKTKNLLFKVVSFFFFTTICLFVSDHPGSPVLAFLSVLVSAFSYFRSGFVICSRFLMYTIVKDEGLEKSVLLVN